jgi:uncharacterized protein (UPF0216 family)
MVKKEFEKYQGHEKIAKIHGAIQELGHHLPERKKKLQSLLKKEQKSKK